MTVIAVDVRGEDIVIGADSQITYGYHMRVDNPPKLIRSKTGVILAGTGAAEGNALMRLYLENNRPREASEYAVTEFITDFRKWAHDRAKDPNLATQFLLAVDGVAYEIHDYYIALVTTFKAMGAGLEYAEAAMYLGQTVEQAIRAACHLSTACNEPIRVERMPKADGA